MKIRSSAGKESFPKTTISPNSAYIFLHNNIVYECTCVHSIIYI